MNELILLLYFAGIVETIKPIALILSFVLAIGVGVMYVDTIKEAYAKTRKWFCAWAIFFLFIGMATPDKETIQVLAAVKAGATATELFVNSDLGKKAYSVLDSYLDEALDKKKLEELDKRRR